MITEISSCEQLHDRLAAFHRASLEMIQEVSLESLLERVAVVARDQAMAQYAVVGMVNDTNNLEYFFSSGSSDDMLLSQNDDARGREVLLELLKHKESLQGSRSVPDKFFEPLLHDYPEITSLLSVPISNNGRRLGQIMLANKVDAESFSADDCQVIETLANYAAVTITNARLYRKLIERDQMLTLRNRNLALLNKLASALASSADVDQVLERALNEVLDHLHIEVGDIFLREEKGKLLRLAHHSGSLLQTLWVHSQFQMGEGMLGTTAQTGQPQAITVPTRHPYGMQIHPGVAGNNLNQVVCLPLWGQREVLGVLSLAFRQPVPLDEQDMQFLSLISSWVGTAIENMRLNLQQRRLAILEERERIGMDLHDGIIQSIYAVGLTLEHTRILVGDSDLQNARQRIEQAIRDLNSTIRDIRAYILDLRPRQLRDENLVDGVQHLLNEFRANTLVEVAFNSPQDGLANLPDAQTVALFHICQEALANAAKHSRARRVDVSIWTTADRALLEVSDDGRGLDLQNVKLTLGHGLSNMQTRATSVGGDVEISSEPGSGVSILAWVPLGE